MKRVSATITSDFICPWCFIGERRLARAAAHLSEDLGEEIRLDISWRPFELNPDIPAEGIDRRAYRIAKFGSWEHSQRLDAHVTEAGKPDGAVFHYDRISRTPNTRSAHRLVWWSMRERGNADLLVDRLFEAYFVEGRDLSSAAELAGIAAKADIPRDAVTAFLGSDEGTNQIIAAETEAYRNGIHGVPDFRIGPAGFSGAQPMEIMTGALRRASANLSKS